MGGLFVIGCCGSARVQSCLLDPHYARDPRVLSADVAHEPRAEIEKEPGF